MHVYLVGFMGSGKSAVGRALAARLGVPFADLDAEVEAAAGSSVGEIFARRGETVFRRLEREALAALVARPGPLVVATGGGTPAQPACAALLAGAAGGGALTVWLDVPWETLLARIAADGAKQRPLFRDEEQARALLAERRPVYAAADLRLRLAAGEGVEAAASRLAALLAAHREAHRGAGGAAARRSGEGDEGAMA